MAREGTGDGEDGRGRVHRRLARLRLFGREVAQILRHRGFLPLLVRPVDRDAVALWGYVHSHIGLGQSARGFREALGRLATPGRVHAVALPGRDSVSVRADPVHRLAGTNLVVLNPPEMMSSRFAVPMLAMSRTRTIGYWVWELPQIPRSWLPALDLVDEIWTCTRFVASALRRATDRPVRVVPHVVNDWRHADARTARAVLGLPDDDVYTFLTVFDFDSGFERKNPLATIAAFRAAFGDGPDGPRLLLKCHGGGHCAAAARLQAAAAACPRIRVVDAVWSNEQMQALFDATDAFVSLHRAEGFGLNIAQAMIAGRPVVVTGWSGNMDFTSADTAFLVDWREKTIAPGDYVAGVGQTWADPDVDDAARHMRRLVAAPGPAAAVAERGRRRVLDLLSPSAVAAVLADALEAARSGTTEPVAVDPDFEKGGNTGLVDAAAAGWFDERTGELCPGFEIRAEDVVVDVGCGGGGNAGFCADRASRVVLVDVSADALADARRRLADKPAACTFIESDADPLPLPDGLATRVVCTEVLEHVDDVDCVLSELRRIAAADALCLISVPDARSERLFEGFAPPEIFAKPNHVRIFEQDAFFDALRRNGFEILSVHTYGFYWTLWWAMLWAMDGRRPGRPRALDGWAETWRTVLDDPGGRRLQARLDRLVPKSLAVVARPCRPGAD